MKKKILAITGGTGFIGNNFINLLLEDRGWHIRALTRKVKENTEDITWVYGSLEQPDSLDILIKGSDLFIHAAGEVNSTDKNNLYLTNQNGTKAIIEAIERNKFSGRLVHISSIAAREPHSSHYSTSKANAENIVINSSAKWTIIRPPAIFGIGDTEMVDLFKFAKKRIGFSIIGMNQSLMYVETLSNAIFSIMNSDLCLNKIYELDDNQYRGWSNRQYIKMIQKSTGKLGLIIPMPALFLHIFAFFDEKIRKEKAKLTKDRARYYSHKKWIANKKLSTDKDCQFFIHSTEESIKKSYDFWYKNL